MSSSVGKLSREEFRRQKDLDAARKAGTAPAEVDEEGKAINPHIPQWMAQAPWYLSSGHASLKHQRKPDTGTVKPKLDDWYARGQKAGPAATKFRKGACENCGAMSHKTKECLERPRKKGAKWTGEDIKADEVISSVDGLDKDYDAKRDRWNGYDPQQHSRAMVEYEAVEAARRKLREEEIDAQTSTEGALSAAKKLSKKEKGKSSGPNEDGDFGSESDDDDDEDKYAEKASMVGQKIDTDKRITVRNLRIREDRAKYLYNLNLDSAHYDPKTRSMREAPDPRIRPEDASYAGDNFARAQGDTSAMQKLQLYAWQAEARGNDLHLQANPTVNEMQFREFQQKKDKLRESTKGSILEKYGGAEHFEALPKELLTGQTENYVEYSRSGQIVKGLEKAKARSKYEEDVYEQNHTSIFGSWYDLTTGNWGYACCHGTMLNAYCTGQAGIEASKASDALNISAPRAATEAIAADAQQGKSIAAAAASDSKAAGKRRRSRSRRGSVSDSGSDSRSFSSASSFSSSSRSRSGSRHSDDDRRRSHHSRRDDRRSSKAEKERSSRRSSKKKRKDAPVPDYLVEAAEVGRRAAAKAKQGGRLNEAQSTEVTEEQLEEWRKKNNGNKEDPMANYVDEEV